MFQIEQTMPDTSPIHQPRKSHNSQYYQCVEDSLELFEQVYDDRFGTQYGFFRPMRGRSLADVLKDTKKRGRTQFPALFLFGFYCVKWA